MKSLLVIGLALSVMASACAQKSQPAKTSLTTQSTAKVAALSPIYSPGKCNFRLRLNGGSLSIDNQSYIKGAIYSAPGVENWSFSIRCHAGATQAKINGQLGLIQKDGHILWSATKKPFIPKQNFHLRELDGANWTGRATEYSMLWGGENAVHAFNFCISELHGPQVLCGNIQGLSVAYPKYNKKREQDVLDVIKTIVFVKLQDHSVKPSKVAKAGSR